MSKINNSKVRYPKIDILRGMCLISMMLYHTVWDLVYIYNVDWSWYFGDAAFVWQQSICWTFILLAGFCVPLGSRSVRRGLIVFGTGALITAVTLILMPGQRIVFGVLSLLGSCMLIAGVSDTYLRKMVTKLPAFCNMLVSFILFAFTYSVNDRFVGFFGFKLAELPACLYRNYFTTFLGFPMGGFFSTDYFSLMPWIFLFFTGYFAHFVIIGANDANGMNKNVCVWMQKGGLRPLQWMGRHSLVLYMLHQPVIYGLLWVISFVRGV